MIQPYQSPSQFTPDLDLPTCGRDMPVIGYRAWQLHMTAEEVELCGLHNWGRWDLRVTKASCRRTPPWMIRQHRVPNPSCECGLYAVTTLDEPARRARLSATRLLAAFASPTVVAGAMVGWGRVIQHGEQGWRAEYGRPIGLLDTGHPLLEVVACRYNVPLLSQAGLQLSAREHGESLAPDWTDSGSSR